MNGYKNKDAFVLGAELVEEGIPISNISIHPFDKRSQNSMIPTIKEEEGNIRINTKPQSSYRKRLIQETEKEDCEQELLKIFEKEMNSLRMSMILEKRRYEFSSPEVVNDFYLTSNTLTTRQKSIISHFKPFIPEIIKDLNLIARCLEEITNNKVQILPHKGLYKSIPKEKVIPLNGGWRLNANALLGGKFKPNKPSLKVIICLFDKLSVSEYLPGTSLRAFLENFICPMFLSKHYEWVIELSVENKSENWTLNQENSLCYLDVNSTLS